MNKIFELFLAIIGFIAGALGIYMFIQVLLYLPNTLVGFVMGPISLVLILFVLGLMFVLFSLLNGKEKDE